MYNEYYVLTDPALMSKRKEFGATDLGQDGIDNFFYYHECGEYCDRKWWKSRNPRCVFAGTEGTSLLHNGRLVGTTWASNIDAIEEEDSDYNSDSGYGYNRQLQQTRNNGRNYSSSSSS